jgi:hypothetical protein
MGLTTAGYIFLITAWLIIITLVTYTFYKVFKGQKKKH